jgi:hypothetical protein
VHSVGIHLFAILFLYHVVFSNRYGQV